MKKIAVILFVVSAALAGCHKSKPAAAKPTGGDTAGSAAGSGGGDMGSGGGGGGSGM